MRSLFFGIFALAALGAAMVSAEDTRSISVIGEARVSHAPDLVRLNLGVDARNKTAGEAMAEVSGKMQAVFAELDALGIAAKDRQTTNISLEPIYDYESQRNNSDQLRLLGYTARNALQITIRDLTKVGQVIDRLTQAGSNRLDGIAFDLSDTSELKDELRAAAVKDARRRAEIYASAAGISVGDVMSISEGGGFQGAPIAYATRAEMASVDMPVAGGQLDFSMSLNMVFSIQ